MPRRPGHSGPLSRLLPFVLTITLMTSGVASGAALGDETGGQTLAPVRGRVLDPDARPVPGAQVLILRGTQVIVTENTRAERQRCARVDRRVGVAGGTPAHPGDR
jgi:hypothetical protein